MTEYPKIVTVGTVQIVVQNAADEAEWCGVAHVEPEEVRSKPRRVVQAQTGSPHTKKH